MEEEQKSKNKSSWKWVEDMAKIKVMKQTANKKTKKDDDEGTLNKQSVASSHSGMFAPLFTANN